MQHALELLGTSRVHRVEIANHRHSPIFEFKIWQHERIRQRNQASSVSITDNDRVVLRKTKPQVITNQLPKLGKRDQCRRIHRPQSPVAPIQGERRFNLQQPTTARYERASSILSPVVVGSDMLDLPFSDESTPEPELMQHGTIQSYLESTEQWEVDFDTCEITYTGDTAPISLQHT